MQQPLTVGLPSLIACVGTCDSQHNGIQWMLRTGALHSNNQLHNGAWLFSRSININPSAIHNPIYVLIIVAMHHSIHAASLHCISYPILDLEHPATVLPKPHLSLARNTSKHIQTRRHAAWQHAYGFYTHPLLDQHSQDCRLHSTHAAHHLFMTPLCSCNKKSP